MKKIILVLIAISIPIVLPLHAGGRTEPGRELRETSPESVGCNPASVFSGVVPQNIRVFLVGNNAYAPESGHGILTQSHNDVALMRAIFARCCGIGEDAVEVHRDLTLSAFRAEFERFRNNLDTDAMAIVYYSGHGESNGSLVFTDGGELAASELREAINSFTNDTVLIVDACYSGNNEGPAEFGPDEEAYRDNCIRIYASLAHLLAKEITYDNPFFGRSLPFYRDVLGIDHIEGNGYFTALIGMFFAQYRFQKEENISYQTLVYYVTNKAKTYVETLAQAKGPDKKGAWEEAVYRLNQLPKIHPVEKKVGFRNVNHEYVVLLKEKIVYRPETNHFSLDYAAAASITLPPYDQTLGLGVMPLVSISYNLPFEWGILGIGFATGTQWSATHRGDFPYNLLVYPLALRTRYCSNLASPFFFVIDASAGAAIVQLAFVDQSDYPKNTTDIKFLWNMTLGFGFNISRELGIAATVGYMQLYPFDEQYHLLTPGINITHNLSGK